jgi:hypothetical protein
VVLVATGVAESVTRKVMPKVPVTAGVPLITPVLTFKLRPAGSAPDVMDQVYGVVPPLAANAVV